MLVGVSPCPRCGCVRTVEELFFRLMELVGYVTVDFDGADHIPHLPLVAREEAVVPGEVTGITPLRTRY
jgi:hypothetical protein